jgi:uncharacterized protein (DUF1015 family)
MRNSSVDTLGVQTVQIEQVGLKMIGIPRGGRLDPVKHRSWYAPVLGNLDFFGTDECLSVLQLPYRLVFLPIIPAAFCPFLPGVLTLQGHLGPRSILSRRWLPGMLVQDSLVSVILKQRLEPTRTGTRTALAVIEPQENSFDQGRLASSVSAFRRDRAPSRAIDSPSMARIAPFRALRFDQGRFADLAPLLAPPYDVISETQRKELEASHPRNIVHLDLPRGEADGRYENARAQLDRWLAEGTLRQDARPALYRYEQRFSFTGAAGPQNYTRKGFISLIELSPFSARVVLPHEHTLSGPKVDRFKLIHATRAHFSQVFSLYRDPAGTIEATLDGACLAAPDVDATTPDGCRHRLWVVTDEAVIAAVARGLAPRSVMIADGHHRYETMLAIRDSLRPANVPLGHSLADWGVMFFARAEDPGLLVLPTHRMVHGLSAEALDSLAERCRPWFEVIPGSEEDAAAIEERLRREGEKTVTFGLRRAGAPGQRGSSCDPTRIWRAWARPPSPAWTSAYCMACCWIRCSASGPRPWPASRT